MADAMEDITAAFGSVTSVPQPLEDGHHTGLPKRAKDYKSQGKFLSSDRQRKAALARMKRDRSDAQAFARRLALSKELDQPQDPDEEDEDEEDDDDEDVEEMDDGESSVSIKKMKVAADLAEYERIRAQQEPRRRKRAANKRTDYRRQLMLSKFLEGRPDDFPEAWFVVPCPVGKRSLVISSMGRTVQRNRHGGLAQTFASGLPNGSHRRGETVSRDKYCILDCIFHEPTSTFYVLDMMCWKGYSLYKCDTGFRFYWRNTKLAETEADKVGATNKYRFIPLPCYECDAAGLNRAWTDPLPFERDGLLFYHKEFIYKPGRSPLVCWVEADRVPAIFASQMRDGEGALAAGAGMADFFAPTKDTRSAAGTGDRYDNQEMGEVDGTEEAAPGMDEGTG